MVNAVARLQRVSLVGGNVVVVVSVSGLEEARRGVVIISVFAFFSVVAAAEATRFRELRLFCAIWTTYGAGMGKEALLRVRVMTGFASSGGRSCKACNIMSERFWSVKSIFFTPAFWRTSFNRLAPLRSISIGGDPEFFLENVFRLTLWICICWRKVGCNSNERI